jgi:hypothetical protein
LHIPDVLGHKPTDHLNTRIGAATIHHQNFVNGVALPQIGKAFAKAACFVKYGENNGYRG